MRLVGRNALPNQQRRHPIAEAVVAKRRKRLNRGIWKTVKMIIIAGIYGLRPQKPASDATEDPITKSPDFAARRW